LKSKIDGSFLNLIFFQPVIFKIEQRFIEYIIDVVLELID